MLKTRSAIRKGREVRDAAGRCQWAMSFRRNTGGFDSASRFDFVRPRIARHRVLPQAIGLRVADKLAAGFVVDHVITAGYAVVTFELVARKPPANDQKPTGRSRACASARSRASRRSIERRPQRLPVPLRTQGPGIAVFWGRFGSLLQAQTGEVE